MTERQRDDPDPVEPGCVACGSRAARPVDTPDGRILMCPSCVALHDVGCP